MEQLLLDEYAKLLLGPSVTGKNNILNNIVQVKLSESHLKDHHQDFSLDVKAYILSLIEVADMAPQNYDGIKKKKLQELFGQFNKNDIPFYLDFLIRHLQKSHFEEEVEIFQKLKIKTEIYRASKNLYKPVDLFKFIINLSLYNLTTLILTLLGIAMLICTVLLPAPNEFMENISFDIEYFNYSQNFILNHFTNIVSLLVGANDDIKIVGRDVTSASLLIAFKVFSYIYVSTLVLNKMNDIIKR